METHLEVFVCVSTKTLPCRDIFGEEVARATIGKNRLETIMSNIPIFYISSFGSSATTWLSRALSSHEKIVCRHAHDISQYKNSSEFFDALHKEAKNIGGLAGAIHCTGAHGVFLRRPIKSVGGRFAGLLREPIKRTSSQITEKQSWATPERASGMLAEYRSKVPALIHAIEVGLESISPKKMEFINASYKTLYFDTQLMIESSRSELFKFEEFTTDIKNFSALITHVANYSVSINTKFLEETFNSSAINQHHKTPPPVAEEIFDAWDEDSQLIFALCMHYCHKNYNTLEHYKSLGYLGLPQLSDKLSSTVTKLLNSSVPRI